MFINIVEELIETNVMDIDEEIGLVLKGCDGDKEEYWNNPDIPIRCKIYICPELKVVMLLNGCVLKCGVCENNLCSVVFTARISHERPYLCGTCTALAFTANKTEDIIVGEGNEIATGTKITTYEQMIRIYRLRKRQKSVRAVLTLLNHRSQHRLPNDLIRTLKGYLY